MRKHHGLGLCKNVMDGMSKKLANALFRTRVELRMRNKKLTTPMYAN